MAYQAPESQRLSRGCIFKFGDRRGGGLVDDFSDEQPSFSKIGLGDFQPVVLGESCFGARFGEVGWIDDAAAVDEKVAGGFDLGEVFDLVRRRRPQPRALFEVVEPRRKPSVLQSVEFSLDHGAEDALPVGAVDNQ